MKRYLFFAFSVFGIGGGQRYVANKAEYLKKKGFDVYTFSHSLLSSNGEIYYAGLEQAENFVMKELRFYPDAYPKHKTKKILQKVVDLLPFANDDEIVIESNYLIGALWAERVAERFKAKHIIYSVSEHNRIDMYMRDFLEFKAKRGEFSTISTRSVKELLAQSKVVTEQNLQILHANLGDPIEDITDERIQTFERGDYNICIIGRGEKRYVEYACEEIVKFSRKHTDKRFSVGLISQFNSTLDKKIHKLFDSTDNIKCHYWGYFAPFPRTLFEMFDLYVGGAGCATLPYRQNALTLAMDLYNDKALGLIGYDGCTSVYPAKTEQDTAEYLEDVFFTKYYLEKKHVPATVFDKNGAYDSHMQFVENSSDAVSYYSVINKNVGLKQIIKANFPILVSLSTKLLSIKKCRSNHEQ